MAATEMKKNIQNIISEANKVISFYKTRKFSFSSNFSKLCNNAAIILKLLTYRKMLKRKWMRQDWRIFEEEKKISGYVYKHDWLHWRFQCVEDGGEESNSRL